MRLRVAHVDTNCRNISTALRAAATHFQIAERTARLSVRSWTSHSPIMSHLRPRAGRSSCIADQPRTRTEASARSKRAVCGLRTLSVECRGHSLAAPSHGQRYERFRLKSKASCLIKHRRTHTQAVAPPREATMPQNIKEDAVDEEHGALPPCDATFHVSRVASAWAAL